MRTILNDAASPAHESFIDRKSEFIGDAIHAADEQEALAFVAAIRERHPKARHVAFAAVFGGDGTAQSERMSDDGEPSGTAGKPILDVLRQSDVTNTVITVTRYFGGILLGSGGLIRAYSTAASMALKAADTADLVPSVQVALDLDYAQHAMARRLADRHRASVDGEEFAAAVHATLTLPREELDSFLADVRETFNARVTPQVLGESLRPVSVR